MTPADFLSIRRRKKVRHYNILGDAHFLTFSCFHRLPLLSKDRTRKWLIESIGQARAKHGFQLWAWVIMPEHVHLLIHPIPGGSKIEAILSDIKRPVAQRAIAYLVDRKSSFLQRLMVENKNRTYHRFWQAGPGQDHNVFDADTAYQIAEYIHNNPVRRGLVACPEEWAWSSARNWAGETHVPIVVNRTLPSVVVIPSHER